jgi:hypothetical protein
MTPDRLQPPGKRDARDLAVAGLGPAFAAFMGLALGGRIAGRILAQALGPYGEGWAQRARVRSCRARG